MIKIFKSFGGYSVIAEPEKGCWINVSGPTEEELSSLATDYHIPADFLRDIQDIDERPRIEVDDDWTIIIMRIPAVSTDNGVPFYTVPLGIFMSADFTVTISMVSNDILPFDQPSLYRENYQSVTDVFNFIIRLFLRSGTTYMRYLKQINQQISIIEKDLEKSIKNKELNKLLKMEKCFVYFITSIKANEIVLMRLKNWKKITGELNEDLFEDALIENKQALEMAQIYSDIQSGMMDAFASVISNNLNVVMKQLTSISIILMIPTLIASLYGMNIPNYLEHSMWAFPVIFLVSGILAFAGIAVFRKKDWF